LFKGVNIFFEITLPALNKEEELKLRLHLTYFPPLLNILPPYLVLNPSKFIPLSTNIPKNSGKTCTPFGIGLKENIYSIN